MFDRMILWPVATVAVAAGVAVWMVNDLAGRAQAVLDLPEGPAQLAATHAVFSAAAWWLGLLAGVFVVYGLAPFLVTFVVDVYETAMRAWSKRRVSLAAPAATVSSVAGRVEG